MDKQELFAIYDELRESGIMNMMLAPSMVSETYGIDKEKAKEAFFDWCKDEGRFND